MTKPIVDPEVPYVGEIPDEVSAGRMVRIQGVVAPGADRFNINLAAGPNNKPRDDTVLHISVRLKQGYVARNSYIDGSWGDEQDKGKLTIGPGQHFEIIVLCDVDNFKVAINGQHFCEFPYRIPLKNLSHLLIDGDVHVTLISWEGNVGTAPLEGGDLSRSAASAVEGAGAPNAPPAPGPPGGGYGPPPQGYQPPPGQGGYGPPPQGYGPPPGGMYGPPPPGYGPPPPPGSQQESGLEHFMSSAQNVLAEAIASGAAEKLMGSFFGPQNPNQSQGYNPQNAQYGIYPSLGPQQQPQHAQRSLFGGNRDSGVPQVGGDGSVGGLGSILGSLASSLFRPQSQGDHHQGGPSQGRYN